MSAFKNGDLPEDKFRAASELLVKFRSQPEFQVINDALGWMWGHVDSAPIKVIASLSESRYYPMALRFGYEEIAYYLTSESRPKARLKTLYSVYKDVRRRIDYLDIEFKPYIDRLTKCVQTEQPIRSAFPDDEVKRRFCAPSALWPELEDLLVGIPDAMQQAGAERRIKLSTLEGHALRALMMEVATEAKSRALGRFYDAFLEFFVERVLCAFNSDGVTVWECVDDDQAFHEAIQCGLRAVEQP
jgi:hypothetical protein